MLAATGAVACVRPDKASARRESTLVVPTSAGKIATAVTLRTGSMRTAMAAIGMKTLRSLDAA